MEHNFFPMQSVFTTCGEMENHFLGQSNVFVKWGKTIFRSKLKIALYLSEITSVEKKRCIKVGCLNGGTSQFHFTSSELCKNSNNEKRGHVEYESVL